MKDISFLDLGEMHRALAEELESAILGVIASGRYVRGPEVELFEAEFAAYCGQACAVGVGNGLEALQLTLQALGVGPGDEVLVSAHTSIATWLAISHAGAQPVPVEPRSDTMLVDPQRVEAAIGPRTAALVPVHLYGMPAEMDALASVARKHRLALVEDASQAHGAHLHDRPVGALSDATAYSLYPTKNLGALGDAGIVTSDDETLLERIRMLANYGERERHHSELLGHNSRLDELQAAVLRVKLKHLDQWNEHRRRRAHDYFKLLADCPGVVLPGVTPGSRPVWHQFVVRVPARDRVREQLAERGIETLVHYPIPPHRSPAYASDQFEPLPLTEQLAASVLSLPMSSSLGPAQCAQVCETVRAVIERAAMASPGS